MLEFATHRILITYKFLIPTVETVENTWMHTLNELWKVNYDIKQLSWKLRKLNKKLNMLCDYCLIKIIGKNSYLPE